jgi:hypothetical protein
MSTKFEQLLDLIVNEESEKAQELFHAIVVEKSREIYENLIAEEAEEEEMDESADDEEMDEAKEEEDESVEEGAEEDEEEMDESMDLEDSYSMEAGDEHDPMSGSGDATDDLGSEIGGDDMGGEEGHEADEDSAIMDIKTAIQELEAAFAELEQAQGGEKADMGFGSEEEPTSDEDEGMMMGMHEGRRITREYTEKVGNDWDKSGSQKTQGQYVGSGSGDKEGSPVEGRSPIASGKNKPGPANVNGRNLVQGSTEGQSNTGTSPNKVNKGITPEKGEKFASGIHNVDGKKSGIKTVTKQGAGYPGNNKTPGPVGSGTGDKAGQTSVGQAKSPINGAPNRNA